MTVLLYFERRDEDLARLASGTCPQCVCLSVCLSVCLMYTRCYFESPRVTSRHLKPRVIANLSPVGYSNKQGPLWTRLVCRPPLFSSVSLKRFGFQN
jgi:hypothetical protein